MTNLPRLNGIIRAFEQGVPAFSAFVPPDPSSALAFSTSPYDGIIFEMEHGPFDISRLQDSFQYLLNRRQILDAASPVPAMTPIVRIPSNGVEMNQSYAKQVLDIGAYGVVWPHIGTAEQAYNAVSACRYPRPQSAPLFEPEGKRGDGPSRAVRYWGVTQAEYYSRADVWPLDPAGEILCAIMVENLQGVENIEEMLSRVDGIGLVMIGLGDLSQNMGHPRNPDHPEVRVAIAHIVAICKAHGVKVGNPDVHTGNVERVLSEGFDFCLAKPTISYPALKNGWKIAGRSHGK